MTSKTGNAEYKVAVVIPAYNAAKTVARSIESVLAQTYAPAEIIVVDDGSSDDTSSIVAKYGPPVRLFKKDNGGVSSARNFGIASATADWIAFLDSDDAWLPAHLEQQIAILRRHPDLVWACGASEVVCDGAVVNRSNPPPAEMIDDDVVQDALVARTYPQPWWISVGTMLVRRDALAEVGTFDTTLRVREDFELTCRLAARYPKIGYVADSVVHYAGWVRQSLTSSRPRNRSDESHFLVTERLFEAAARLDGPRRAAMEKLAASTLQASAAQALRDGLTRRLRDIIRGSKKFEKITFPASVRILACVPQPIMLRISALARAIKDGFRRKTAG